MTKKKSATLKENWILKEPRRPLDEYAGFERYWKKHYSEFKMEEMGWEAHFHKRHEALQAWIRNTRDGRAFRTSTRREGCGMMAPVGMGAD